MANKIDRVLQNDNQIKIGRVLQKDNSFKPNEKRRRVTKLIDNNFQGQKWFVADSMSTMLINNNGDEMARSERTRRTISSAAARHREFHIHGEELHHQHGDPAADGDEKCRIM